MEVFGIFLLLLSVFHSKNTQADVITKRDTTSLPEPPKSTPPGFCVVPSNPENGSYKVVETTGGTYKPGDHVSPFSILTIYCNRSYKPTPPDGAGVSVCANGKWVPEPVTCPPSCPALHSTKTTKITCTFEGKTQSCDNPVENTLAILTCEPLHEEPSLVQRPLRTRKGGAWDWLIPQCYSVCGLKPSQGVPNIIRGQFAKRLDYPWHVGIFKFDTKENICAGSILTERVILSAAHCFTDLANGYKYSKENYLVAAGKYYRKYDEPRDEYAQYSSIEGIHIPTRYKGGVLNYEADIAVVVLSNKLTFSFAVQPVCVDWRTTFEFQQISEKNSGTIVGWDFSVEKEEPTELKELSVRAATFEQCYEKVPEQLRKFLTHDAVCAEFLHKNTTASECKGISGGGLTFLDGNGRYYIRGVASAIPEGTCDSTQHVIYTLVSKYNDFINQFVNA